ncbi:unnamed protein product [Ambrosiozyma monospora]|uniref:Unnamed protein product n=1 Tax=Ambrosiozyma monospora TaxID=43982 RepID=A0A9W6YYC2_AMBMO|nr:unnamed protein product [Ambrosiozyma monospora]
MWDGSDENEMIIKNSLLRVLRDLTNSFKDDDIANIHSIVLPLISVCCDDSSEYHSLLCEDGFETLYATLKNFPLNANLPEQLVADFPLVVKGLLNWTEILPMVLQIVRSYAILQYKIFETELGLEVFKIIGGYLSSMRDDSIAITAHMLEILLLQIPSNEASQSKIILNLMESGLLNEMINYVTRESQSPKTEVQMLLPLLRLIILDSDFFFKLFDHITTITGDFNLSIRFSNLIDALMVHLKLVYDGKIRKLFVLALLSLHTNSSFAKYMTRDPSVDLEYQLLHLSETEGISLVLSLNFNKMMFIIAHFLEEVSETPSGDCTTYHRPSSYDDDYLGVEEPEDALEAEQNEYALNYAIPKNNEFKRYNAILNQFEPVYKVNLKSFLKFKFTEVINKVEGFGYLMQCVDRETMDQLELIL